MTMAKFKRNDPQNKKSSKTVKSEHRHAQHMANRYFRMKKNIEKDQHLVDDMNDYFEDHPFRGI